MRQKHDDWIGTSARARATSSCCLTIRAGSVFPRRTRHSWYERARRYDELYATYTSLYPALREAMHALAG